MKQGTAHGSVSKLAYEVSDRLPWASPRRMQKIINIFTETIIEGVCRDVGEKVYITNFGQFFSFWCWDVVNEHWRVGIKFYVSPYLKGLVNGVPWHVFDIRQTGGNGNNRPNNWQELLAEGLAVHEKKYPLVDRRRRSKAS